MTQLQDYRSLIGREAVTRIRKKAAALRGKHIAMVSSTHQGGGVAEILNTLVFLLNDVGVDCGWRIIHGDPDFFSVTKKMHNLLQGGRGALTTEEKNKYLEMNNRFCVFTHLDRHDLVVVHDPQPAAFASCEKRKGQPWIWRCHIDLSAPNTQAMAFLRPFLRAYDRVVVSDARYGHGLPKPQSVIHPAIDPLSPKNAPLTTSTARRLLREQGVDPSRPFIAQVSRYDRWKDPEGVVRVFDRVKKRIPDVRLVLLGNTASDDPEGVEIYNRMKTKYGKRPDITLLVNVPDNDRFVNAVQSQAAVIVQKSLREGFGLTVSEALWKGTPVVASNVGGIPLQVRDGPAERGAGLRHKSGFLHHPTDDAAFAKSLVTLLSDAKQRRTLGANGRAHVKDHFLITRLLEDWLDLFQTELRS